MSLAQRFSNRIRAPKVAQNRENASGLLRERGGRVHLGCNDVRLEGFVNVDCRMTRAVDIVHDCNDLSIFPSASASLVFSNAFFEHVYVSERSKLLKDCARVVDGTGLVLFSGIPDFEGVARAYLERKPGNVGPRFDLYEVYRYTHGDPEGTPTWWLAQLHKGLFDRETILDLLRKAGFISGQVFGYCWGSEPNAVTLGFCASTGPGAANLPPHDLVERLLTLRTGLNPETFTVHDRF